MNKYNTLVNILDSICDSAPENFSSYKYAGKTEEQINQCRSKAYIHLFLLVSFGIEDFKTRHDLITDGPSDGGLDAYFIDQTTKTIYMIQSKFRSNSNNFESKEISFDDLMLMDIDRILNGDEIGQDGKAYNGKVKGFQNKLSNITDLPRYNYKIIILANLKNERLLDRLFGSYEREIFDYERTYQELVFPMCSSTYYKNRKIVIEMEIDGKIEEVNETFNTSYGNCDVTLLFVPILDIARMIRKYKNSILEFNPRNYLSMSKNKVNKGIKESACDNSDDFTLLNNGITMICSQYESTTRTGKKNTTKISMDDPQILNGGQTAYTLSKILEDENGTNELKGKKVLLKVISIYNNNDDNIRYNKFVNKISDATNKQSKIDEADRRSNDQTQRRLQTEIFEKFGLYYERKAGEFEDVLAKKIINSDMILKRDILLKSIWAFEGKCGEARNNSGDKIFKEEVFNQILHEDIDSGEAVYAYLIYKNIIKIEKQNKNNGYNIDKWGYALRYGKFAVLSAYAISYKYPNDIINFDYETNIFYLLDNWKKFEDYAKNKNEKYFGEQNEYDNYYKSANVDRDVLSFFGN